MAEIAGSRLILSPDEFDEACLFHRSIRRLPGIKAEYFLHAICVPLRQIDFTRTRKRRRALPR